MADKTGKNSSSQDGAGIKRRGLLRFGTLVTAFTGASAISAIGANNAQAAPGDKNPPNTYVPIAEKGVASGVATLDVESKIPVEQVPDLTGAYAPAGGSTAYVSTNGPRVVHTGGFTRADVIATLNRAEANGKGSIVEFGSGTYDVGTGLSLSGYSCAITGTGAAGTSATQSGTVFYASGQRGPVLDFSGWVSPQNFQGRLRHGGFLVKGSGVADPTKTNGGIRIASLSSTTFSDIAVRDTGGPCWEHVSTPGYGVYLCDFERITLNTPVAAKMNDVPYFIATESNGNRFRGIGLRSVLASGDVGLSGAFILNSNSSYSAHDNEFDACWVENLHVPAGGTVVSMSGNTNIHSDWQFFDTQKEAGTTGTSYFRFMSPATANYGGNILRGVIPGRSTGPNDIDTGVDMRQSRNHVSGVKGYKGANVTIAPGISNTFVMLGGAQSNATDPAVVDNSGVTTNTVIDYYLGTFVNGARTLRQGSASTVQDQPGGVLAGGIRIYDPAVPSNGAIGLGTSSTRINAVGRVMYMAADHYSFRKIDLTPAPVVLGDSLSANVSWRSGSGTPEGVVTAAIGSLYSRTDGGRGTSLYIKESGDGNVGWVAK